MRSSLKKWKNAINLKSTRSVMVLSSLGALVVLVGAVAGVAWYIKAIDDTVITIEGEKISKQTYDSIVTQAKVLHYTEEEARDAIVQSHKAYDIAKANGIVLDEKTLRERAAWMLQKEYSELNEWERAQVLAGSLVDDATFLARGGYDVYVFNVPFSEGYGMYGDNQLVAPEELARRQVAAKKYAEEVRARLVADPSKAEEIARTLRTTEPHKNGYGFSTNLSRRMLVTEQAESYQAGRGEYSTFNVTEATMGVIRSLPVGGVSAVTEERANLSTAQTAEDNPYLLQTVPIAYQVYYLQAKVAAVKGVDQKVRDQLASLKVVNRE